MALRHLFAAAFIVFGGPALALDMSNRCFANAWESCYLVIKGPISADAPDVFVSNAAQMDGNKVVFDSDGGDPIAAMALGRLIKERGLETVIGEWGVDGPVDGACVNACLYAFLGGVARGVGSDSRVGFDGVDSGFGQGALRDQRIVSATQHLIEMGAAPELLLRSPESSPLTRKEIENTGIAYVPPGGFDHFLIEPYKDGVVAASKRLDSATPYDRVEQLTTFCRDGELHFMMTAAGGFMADNGDATLRYWTGDGDDAVETEVQVDNYKTWFNDTSGFVQFSFDPSLLSAFDEMAVLTLRFSPGRVFGGTHYYRLELNQTDRQMLSAAFRFCI